MSAWDQTNPIADQLDDLRVLVIKLSDDWNFREWLQSQDEA